MKCKDIFEKLFQSFSIIIGALFLLGFVSLFFISIFIFLPKHKSFDVSREEWTCSTSQRQIFVDGECNEILVEDYPQYPIYVKVDECISVGIEMIREMIGWRLIKDENEFITIVLNNNLKLNSWYSPIFDSNKINCKGEIDNVFYPINETHNNDVLWRALFLTFLIIPFVVVGGVLVLIAIVVIFYCVCTCCEGE